eukprot:967937-Prymnesium_polylepis.1
MLEAAQVAKDTARVTPPTEEECATLTFDQLRALNKAAMDAQDVASKGEDAVKKLVRRREENRAARAWRESGASAA